MPIFDTEDEKFRKMNRSNFDKENELRSLVESNIDTIFNCRHVATEYGTGKIHSGRIDTLAISEEYNPVIIEYKIQQSHKQISQSLYYLNWIKDHKGDFETCVDNNIEETIDVQWNDIRVICIAPRYHKFDIHAVRVIDADIELWEYERLEGGIFRLEKIFDKQVVSTLFGDGSIGKPSNTTKTKSFDDHIKGKSEDIKNIAVRIDDYITDLDHSIKQKPRGEYIAYKTSQNIVCMQVQKRSVKVQVKVDPDSIDELPSFGEDVSDKGTFGTGDVQLKISNSNKLESVKKYIDMSYESVEG